MLIDELIEKAFCDGYEFAQKEFAGANRLLSMGKNSPLRVARTNELLTPSGFRNGVDRYINPGGNPFRAPSESNIRSMADKARNKSLGARTISQVKNIEDNHAFRLTPKRVDVIKSAIKNRENKSNAVTGWRQNQISTANSLSSFL